MFQSDNLKALITKGGVPFKEGAVSFIFSCPRCRKARKLYIRKTDGKFVCFVCKADGFYGRAEYALHEILNTPLSELKEALYGESKLRFTDFMNFEFKSPWLSNEEEFGKEESFEGLGEVTFPLSFKAATEGFGAEYLIKRGLTQDIIQKYGIMYNPSWKTVVFPVHVETALVGWQERSTVNDFKYTLKNFHKEKTLMYVNNLINSPHAVLTEGPVDGIKADLCGGNVSSMGKGVSSHQLDIIKGRVKRLYLALDPDATKELDRICRHMYDYMDEIYLLTPPKGKKDLGECTFEEVYSQFKAAPRYCGQLFFNLKVK